MQSNLTFDDYERAAFITGHPLPGWFIDTAEELEGARQYVEVATDFAQGQSPDELKANLEELNAIYSAMPDGVSNADELSAYVHQQEAIANERDELLAALETLQEGVKALSLKARKQRIAGAHLHGLYEWIYFAANERQSIDAFHFNRDIGID